MGYPYTIMGCVDWVYSMVSAQYPGMCAAPVLFDPISFCGVNPYGDGLCREQYNIKCTWENGNHWYWHAELSHTFHHVRDRVIRVLPAAGPPESEGIVTSIEPETTSGLLVARVYENDQVISNVDVRLQIAAKANTGGHFQHGADNSLLRTGTLTFTDAGTVSANGGQVLIGNTGPEGLYFHFNAPAVSGDILITASCTGATQCAQEGPDTVWVGVKDLLSLGLSQYFVPVGDTPNHFDNHYLTSIGQSQIYVLSALYRAKFPNSPLLHLNDASLERGGRFDVNSDWAPPHFEHCRGTEIDVRANDALSAIPAQNRREFERLARTVGAEAMFEIPEDKDGNPLYHLRHYHVRLTGARPQCP